MEALAQQERLPVPETGTNLERSQVLLLLPSCKEGREAVGLHHLKNEAARGRLSVLAGKHGWLVTWQASICPTNQPQSECSVTNSLISRSYPRASSETTPNVVAAA